MAEEQKKIQQLEEELERLSSQVNHYRQQLNQLKENISSPQEIKKEEPESYIPSQKKQGLGVSNS